MWRNVAEKLKILSITLHHLARICEPQFATLSHIEPQKMWRKVEPQGKIH